MMMLRSMPFALGTPSSPTFAGEFMGYTQVNVTNITIPSININISEKTAPYMLEASAKDVVVSGARLGSLWALSPHLCDIRWTVTKADGSPIEYDNCIVNNLTGMGAAVVNPATDTVGMRLSVLIHEVGDIKVTLSVTGKTTEGYITESVTETHTIGGMSSVSYKYVDAGTGNDSNDGLDGLGVTASAGSISYTDSTKTLSGTGIGTGITLDNLPRTNTNDFIHLKTATEGSISQRVRIASVSADAIVLEDALGQDYTNVVPSTGPKLTFDGNDSNNVLVMLRNGQTYLPSNEYHYKSTTKINAKGIIGYGSGTRAKLFSTNMWGGSGSSGTSYINSGVDSTTYAPKKMIVSRIELDCNEHVYRAISGNQSSGSPVDTFDSQFIIHDCKWLDPKEDKAFQITAYSKKMSISVFGGDYNNQPVAPRTPSASGAYIELGGGGWLSILGTVAQCNGTNSNVDHFWYPKGQSYDMHAGWNWFKAGTSIGYGLNTDNSSTSGLVNSFFSIHDNQQDAGSWVTDFSNASNDPTLGSFSKVQLFNNYSSKNGITWNYLLSSVFAKGNRCWGGDAVERRMFHTDVNAGFDQTLQDTVLEDNLGHDFALIDQTVGTDSTGNLECYGNKIYHTSSDTALVLVGKDGAGVVSGASTYIDGNIFYAPNDADGEFLISSGTTKQTLSAFNSALSATNVSINPNWTDPANGDFSI